MNKPVIESDGSTRWYLDGQLHREDGPAIEYKSGSKAWYRNGLRHREDGPAVELNDGTKQWWLNGYRHRTDGPAVEHPDGKKEWWTNGTTERVEEEPISNSSQPQNFEHTLSRSKEKWDFWKKFLHRDVAEVYKGRLFELFDNRCFRCGATDRLQIDHHLPRTLGGVLEAGNMVVLCSRCNNAKGTIDPEVFYGQRHLSRLPALFDAQSMLFDFNWDWKAYNRDKRAYFSSLGVPCDKLERIFNDPEYDGYIELESSVTRYTIDVTDELSAAIQRMAKPENDES